MTSILNGASGVEINIFDKSGRPTNTGNKYNIGLVGWTPKGPSNIPVYLTKESELYALFGTPLRQTSKSAFLLHNAKIALNAGAGVIAVRAVKDAEGLDYYVYGADSNTVLEYATVSKDNTLKSETYGISDVATKGRYNLKAYSDSTFTAFMKYPGFTGYYISVQAFESSIKGTDGKAIVNGYENAHSLNVHSGPKWATQDRYAFKSFVQGNGLYQDLVTTDITVYLVKGTGAEFQLKVEGNTVDTFKITTSSDKSAVAVASYGGKYYAIDEATNTFKIDTVSYYPSVGYGDILASEGGFYTLNGDLIKSTGTYSNKNTALNYFLQIALIVRLFESSISDTAIETIRATVGDYVTDSGSQLNLLYADSTLLTFKLGTKAIPNSGATTTPTKMTSPNLSSVYSRDSATLATAWGMFKDIDAVDVSMLVDGGSSIIGFGEDTDNTDAESTDLNVVTAMLTVSSYRLDCPSIFDAPKRRSAAEAVRAAKFFPSIGNETGGSTAPYAVYWGNLQDGRQIINDTFNRRQVECARSIFKGITAFNIATKNKVWNTQWGPNRGGITTPSLASLNPRKYPDEVGLLSQSRINPSRINSNGEFFWDDYTLMAKNSVLQRWHAVCFLANLNKRYRRLLEQYVAELNTPILRNTIYTLLHEDLKAILTSDPPGLYNFYVICDESNNTPDVIDAGKLNVDVGLEIARDTRVITLNTTLYRTNGIIESGISI